MSWLAASVACACPSRFAMGMLGVAENPSTVNSLVSDLERCAGKGDDWPTNVCGVDGRSSETDRGVEGGRGSPGTTTEALTVSVRTSAMAALGAAMPKPRCPSLMCRMKLGVLSEDGATALAMPAGDSRGFFPDARAGASASAVVRENFLDTGA